MVIRVGEDWGSEGPVPSDTRTAADDAELSHGLADRVSPGTAPQIPVSLLGGDLRRTLGGPGGPGEQPVRRHLPVDVGLAHLRRPDGRVDRVVFVAHLLLRGWLWRGPIILLANAQWMGEYNVAPRGHPNDGRLDLLVAHLSWSDKLAARRRLRSGTHVPHPDIEQRRVVSFEIAGLQRGTRVFADGRPVGAAKGIEVSCVPDAVTVIV